jgi:hypothetical protein
MPFFDTTQGSFGMSGRKDEENQQARNVTGNSIDAGTSAEARKAAYSQSRSDRCPPSQQPADPSFAIESIIEYRRM